MGKIKQYKYIIFIALVVLGFVFYWFEWRPAQIRKDCAERNKDKVYSERYSNFYNQCLREMGL